MKINKIFILLYFGIANCLTVAAQISIVDSIVFDGGWRNYRLFLPTGFSSSSHLPLVFNLHGYGSTAFEQEIYSGFDNIADTAHAVVCYPDGLNKAWNIINSVPDDVGFIDTMISFLHNKYNINLNRVYSTGMSNGGFMSNLLGCTLANRFAAIAPVAGTNTFPEQSACVPSRHVPVLYIHGTTDPTVSYDGSPLFVSAAALMELWSNADGCSIVTDTFLLPDISTTDGCRAERITWHDCDSNKQVIHYRIINGEHTWPGAPVTIGITNHDFNASGIIWDFFNQFTLNQDDEKVSQKNNILVSPNPFTSHLEINIPDFSYSLINIYSPDGRLIQSAQYNEKNIHLEESNLTPGIYFLNISSGSILKTFRIIKIK